MGTSCCSTSVTCTVGGGGVAGTFLRAAINSIDAQTSRTRTFIFKLRRKGVSSVELAPRAHVCSIPIHSGACVLWQAALTTADARTTNARAFIMAALLNFEISLAALLDVTTLLPQCWERC